MHQVAGCNNQKEKLKLPKHDLIFTQQSYLKTAKVKVACFWQVGKALDLESCEEGRTQSVGTEGC